MVGWAKPTFFATMLADQILRFLNSLSIDTQLPKNIGVLEPLNGTNAAVISRTTKEFYRKYYSDNTQRRMIIGINPGRLGAGLTGIPFSDTKRLASDCGIHIEELSSHEPSSVFVYEVIRAFGGADAFYKEFYITSACPLGFVEQKANGKEVNHNYYDSKELQEAVTPYILSTLKEQIAWGMRTDVAFCLGTGKNFKFLNALNAEHCLFDKLVPLEHPRYVVQYRSKFMDDYVDKFLAAFAQ